MIDESLHYVDNLITLFIFALGLITVTLSVVVAVKFSIYKKNVKGGASSLANAISLQLIGESIIGFGTLIFSSAAYYGVLESWPLHYQSLIRFVMFFATALTTFHLLRTLNTLDE